MDLYLDRSPEKEEDLTKEGGFAARLSEAPENWPQELTSELYKQLPFLSDYEVSVNLDRVDSQRGFAFGYADVANKTERPETEHDDAGIPHIRIPIVGQERSVKPFSVFLDGERALPLTEERIRETLFNPAAFDLSTTLPRDPSLIEPLMPPQRSAMGQGGEYKMASAQVSLLHAIAETIPDKDRQAFIQKVASSPTLQAGFKRAGIVRDLVEVFDQTKCASASDRLAYIADNIQPTVVTLQKLPGGDFLLKSANVNALNPQAMQGQVIPGQEAAQAIGPQNAQAMQPGQVATVVAEPIDLDEPYEAKAKPIEEFGEYKVMDAMGNQLMGWVFPFTLAWDGAFSKKPLALFSNGSAFAVQDSIAGELVGKSTNLPVEQQPVGEGVLFTTSGGNAIATMPITVRSAMAGPDGVPRLMCFDMMGQQLQISFSEGLAQPQRISDMEYAFPRSWKFMRLNNQTQLQGGGQDMGGDPSQMEGAEQEAQTGGQSDAPAQPAQKPKAPKKPAAKKEKAEKPAVQVNVGEQVKKEKTSAVLWFNGAYHIDGGCGLHKLAHLRYDMSPVDAEFTLGLLGVDGITAKQKVAEARRKGQVKLAGLKTITLLNERYAGAEKRASALLRKVPDLRVDLIKEAAQLTDQGTVDSILALNFINPDNLDTFVNYLPELEQTSEKLSEMLLYSYLGMNELPEGAVERSMKNLENVITGLKSLSESGPQEE